MHNLKFNNSLQTADEQTTNCTHTFFSFLHNICNYQIQGNPIFCTTISTPMRLLEFARAISMGAVLYECCILSVYDITQHYLG